MQNMKGNIILYTGNGGGKTAAALGLALRGVGHKKKVIMVQYMKGRKDTGEYMAKERLAPELEITQFGREGFVDLKNPSQADKELAKKGMEYAKESLKRKPDTLILDEINLAAAVGLLDAKDVVSFLKYIPPETIVILTGRNAPKEFTDCADYVVELKDVKRPKKEIPARKGFEY
ncbi:MAG: cob(I)yrinic acid a,c-diamide adenosyltransferase [Candidatus Altiarchaeia archaeon]